MQMLNRRRAQAASVQHLCRSLEDSRCSWLAGKRGARESTSTRESTSNRYQLSVFSCPSGQGRPIFHAGQCDQDNFSTLSLMTSAEPMPTAENGLRGTAYSRFLHQAGAMHSPRQFTHRSGRTRSSHSRPPRRSASRNRIAVGIVKRVVRYGVRRHMPLLSVRLRSKSDRSKPYRLPQPLSVFLAIGTDDCFGHPCSLS